MGQGVERGALEADFENHVTTAHPGWHGFQQRFASIQHTSTGRAVQLVSGEGVEVAAQRLHVYHHMGHRLCAVDDRDDAAFPGNGNELLDWVDSA